MKMIQKKHHKKKKKKRKKHNREKFDHYGFQIKFRIENMIKNSKIT